MVAVVIGDVTIKDNASIWYGVVVRGDMEPITIGVNTNIQDNCTVHTDFGKPAVVGVAALEIDLANRKMSVGTHEIKEGDWISIDGTAGEVYLGQLETMVPDINDLWLLKLLSWADEFRRLGVWANADYPKDAERAREYGAQGIGLCRTEHMFFESERLPHVQKMIMTDLTRERKEALEAILPFQREDFAGLFRAMDGLPVIIRLIDPPLHEFLPGHDELEEQLHDLEESRSGANGDEIKEVERKLGRVDDLHEENPMLGFRGAARYVADSFRPCFEMECAAIRKVRNEMGLRNVQVMIPFVRTVKQARAVIDLMADNGLERGKDDLKITGGDIKKSS